MIDNAESNTIQEYDIILNILNSSNNVNRQIRFVDAYPTMLGSIDFHTQNTDVEYIIGDVSFAYSHFEFIK